MSAAACKIIICGGKLFQVIGEAMERDQSVAQQIIAWLEQMTDDVRSL